MSYVTREAIAAARARTGPGVDEVLIRVMLEAAAPFIAAQASNYCRHCGRRTPTHLAVAGAAACDPRKTSVPLSSRREAITCKRCRRSLIT